MPNRIPKALKIVLLVALISLPVVGWSQRWNIYDSWRLRGFEPSAQMAQLATDTTMTDKARRLFYVNRPGLQEKEAFNKSCRSSELTIVLGCYIAGEGIYLFNVKDERLSGVLQVTAAHEALHAAYDRLSGSEKSRVNNLINDAYAQLKNDRIRGTVDDYKKNGADTTNELHSILGTEVRDLPAELEEYYARYFTNRKAIVAFSEKYEQAFTERKQKIETADKKLEDLKKQIDSGEAELDSREQVITAERNRLDALLAAKNYGEYNGGVSGFNALVSAYNAQVGHIRVLIDQYNTVVAERNAIVAEEGELVKAIDSRPSTLESE